MTKSRGILAPRQFWHADELALLASMYPECHGADCAAWLGKTLSATYQAAKKIGAQKSPEYLASDTACRIQRGKQSAAMIATRFQKGFIYMTTFRRKVRFRWQMVLDSLAVVAYA